MIVGAMRIHKFPYSLDVTIPALAQYVDALVFLFHEASDETMERATAHPKCRATAQYIKRWRQETTLNAMFELIAPFEPTYVIYPDEDEILPDHFPEEFEAAQAKQAASIRFYFVHSWGKPDLICDHVRRYLPHTKVVRWQEGIEFKSRTQCRPEGYDVLPSYKSAYPLRHLAFMTPEWRKERAARHGWKTEPYPICWWTQEHKARPYDPNKSYLDYRRGI